MENNNLNGLPQNNIPTPQSSQPMPQAQFPPLPQQQTTPLQPTQVPAPAATTPTFNNPAQPLLSTLPVYTSNPNLPPLGEPVQNTTDQLKQNNKKRGFPIGRFVTLGVLIFLISGGSIAGYYGYEQLNKEFVPGVSPVVEDYFQPADKQLSLRMNKFIDILTLTTITSAQERNIQVETDYTAAEINEYKTLYHPNTKYITFDFDIKGTFNAEAFKKSAVLGANDRGGVYDETYKQSILSADKGEFMAKYTGLVDNRSLNAQKLNGELSGSLTFDKSTIGFKVDTLSVDNAFYAKLVYFPENPYIDLNVIANKWVKSEYPKVEEATTYIGVQSPAIKIMKKDIQMMKDIFSLPSVAQKVKKEADQTVNGVTAKCYSITLTPDDILNAQKEALALQKQRDSSMANIPESTLKRGDMSTMFVFCFPDGLFMPKKIQSAATFEKDKNASYDISFVWNARPTGTEITAPTDSVIDRNSIKWEDLLKDEGKMLLQNYLDPSETQTIPSETAIIYRSRADTSGSIGKAGDKLTLEYQESIVEPGKEFVGSSKTTTITVGDTKLLPSWQKALTGARVGDKISITILNGKESGQPLQTQIPAGGSVVYTIEVLAIE
jgi:hypothetical protein